MKLIDALRTSSSVFAAELRPPRVELETSASMDAWIDTYHAVRGLIREGTVVFLTDSATGVQEEDNLRHLVTNLGRDVDRDRIVPFLTCKHSLDFCLSYAERAWQFGFSSLVVLGGDRSIGTPRCVEHAWQLRKAVRARQTGLMLGGWANPHADAAKQVEYLLDESFNAEFYLTQIVSHHSVKQTARFLAEASRRGLNIPGLFGVFYYRSARPGTLAALAHFLPVPAAELTKEFGAGADPVEICARSIRALLDIGAKHFYISNLPLGRARTTLAGILERVNVTA